jgi:N-acetylglucosaminyldiphosphoundecaprenol N-acetyl-beta-D-mannosaminyltransferase
MTATTQFVRTSLLGGPVDVVQRHEVLEFIRRSIAQRLKVVVGNQNLHSLYLSRSDARLRRFYARADLIEIDSMPLVYWGWLLGMKTRRRHRATYLDWRDAFWRQASREGWRVFLIGGEPGVAEAARKRLSSLFPGAAIGVHHGFFDKAPDSLENDQAVCAINEFQPDVTLVGMGMPIQECWIDQNIDVLESGATLSVGAAIDYEAGAQPPAPRLLGDLCLEWLYRLSRDPRRLWRRYLVEPWSLCGAAWRDLRTFRKIAARLDPQAQTTGEAEVGADQETAQKLSGVTLSRAA